MMNYEIFREFSEGPHERAVPFTGDSSPGPDEILIDGDWQIVTPAPSSAQIEIAADDLAVFFFKRAGLTVNIARDSRPCGNGKNIYLLIDDSLGAAESHKLEIDEKNICVKGVGSSGVMRGVFYLEELMNFRAAPVVRKMTELRHPVFEARILRSPMAFYYHCEFDHFDFSYPDNYLLKMAHHGFNGIWCRGLLKELAITSVFPEFGAQSGVLLDKLNAFIGRAANFGFKVYLYFTEPMGLRHDDPFFEKYPELRGEPSGLTRAMCVGERKTKDYLRRGFQYLIERTEGLGGVILITASEHQTHCYSHVSTVDGGSVLCPKCAGRTPSAVVAEIISLINAGVRAVSKDVKVIVWNWSWSYYEADPQKNIISSLPDDVILLADFERGGMMANTEGEYCVDEYSLSYTGPSERFQGAVSAAREKGLRVYAKFQIGVTHEIATVPYFPVLFKLAEKFKRAAEGGVAGVLECWNFGNILSLNTELANWFSWKPLPSDTVAFLRKIAVREYGEPAADLFVRAWRIFSEATDNYPFSNPFIYDSPIHHGGAQPLIFKKTGKPLAVTWLLPAIPNEGGDRAA